MSILPDSGSSLRLGLGACDDTFGRLPRRVGSVTCSEPHKSHLKGPSGFFFGRTILGCTLVRDLLGADDLSETSGESCLGRLFRLLFRTKSWFC